LLVFGDRRSLAPILLVQCPGEAARAIAVSLAGRSRAAFGRTAGSAAKPVPNGPPRRGALATRSSTPDSAVMRGESKMVLLELNHSRT